MTDFNRYAPRFKVDDKIEWPIASQFSKTDRGVVKEVIWGKHMHEPLYRCTFGSLIPESLIIAPKLGYDRYSVDMVRYGADCWGVEIELHFREGHGNSMADVDKLVSKILEEHCEHN